MCSGAVDSGAANISGNSSKIQIRYGRRHLINLAIVTIAFRGKDNMRMLAYCHRDSPDGWRSDVNVCVFFAFLQDRSELWPATDALGSTKDGRGLIWLFLLAFGRTAPVGWS
jgi:hypothetical protein